MNKKCAFLMLVLTLLTISSIFCQDKKPGENLTVKIAVMGPGTELYFWFGHIALIIEDSNTGDSYFYDYGLFSFDDDNFFSNFAYGRMLYSCGVSLTERNFAVYRYRRRSIYVYTLDVPPEWKLKVEEFADNNVLPENCDYYYHVFKDNCSTRIRDLIDIATDGQFGGQYRQAPGRFTLRQHVRRHTWFNSPVDWILNFWMGQVIDKPIAIWDEMFLPAEVGRRIEEFWYTDNEGVRRKLVSSGELIYKAEDRPQVLETPRKQWPRELLFSLCLSAIFGSFFFMQSKNIKAGKVLAGVSMSLSGLVFGFAAAALYFLSIFTNHDYTYENSNMLFATPILLAAVPLGICYAAAKKPDKFIFYDTCLRVIWLLTLIGILVSMLIKVFPRFYQQNLTDQMLMLPIALTFALQPVGLKNVLRKYFNFKEKRRKK
jgi:hypothetical protein